MLCLGTRVAASHTDRNLSGRTSLNYIEDMMRAQACDSGLAKSARLRTGAPRSPSAPLRTGSRSPKEGGPG